MMKTLETIERGFERLAAVLSVPQERKLWNAGMIAEYFGLSTSTLYRLILSDPGFPESIKIVGGYKRWVSGEVMAWAESQRESRLTKPGRPKRSHSRRLANSAADSL